MSRQEGLKQKYHVERVDGKPMGPGVVLEFDDPNSWPALMTWAETVRQDGYKRLADDVVFQVKEAQSAEALGPPRLNPASLKNRKRLLWAQKQRIAEHARAKRQESHDE